MGLFWRMMASPTLPPLSPADRVMVLAPHPDDEALGAGGLIQHAVAVGAAVRVLFVTDGDNNPWPQRWLERRWSLGAEDRRRWGARRREEARRSLAALGLPADSGEFLGFPDAELRRRWQQRDPALLAAVTRALAAWRPTLLIAPAARDNHPDHPAVFHFAQAALAQTGLAPAQYSYLIHRGLFGAPAAGLALALTPAQRETKLRAILCHETQMALSRGRFSAYARDEEIFAPEPLPAAVPANDAAPDRALSHA
jgi:LmbE family N-acetylglucosaminyl deacetylase